ncbi:MAG TPA: YeeE/YedE family protein [Aliiroseovarius sp.]|nr:YeeE/YedE family protein [Aliiroseovarius sp.]
MLDGWKEIIIENPAFYLGWGGLLIGIVFGYIVYRTNFCTMGSISDINAFGDWRRFRSWLMAGAVAMLGVAWLERAGIADMSLAMYTGPNLIWGSNIVGGLVFGIGMVLGGGCVSKNLVRTGGGDLRALLVLIVIGITAFMTIGGLFGPMRVAIFTPLGTNLSDFGIPDQRLGTILAAITGMSPDMAGLVALVVVAGGIIIWSLMDRGFRTSPSHMIAGIGIGLCVVAGWLLTGLAFDEFADNPTLISLTFARPTGDSLDYLMRFTAFSGASFGVATVGGTILGAFLGAISQRKFALASFNGTADTVRNLIGAVLMGFGGVLALGCTVGQGLTGWSTLALGSGLTLASIVIGGFLGMKLMERLA